jgi:protein-S-isoprenylcysteine O-methyltransferase Ste14
MASLWFKKIIQKITGACYQWYRLFYSCLYAFLLLLLIVYQYTQKSELLFITPLLINGAAVIAALTGLWVMMLSIKRYFFTLSGIAVLSKQQITSTPLQQGINAYIRHPLYSGTLLVIWSLFLLFPFLNNAIACTVITLYTLIGIRLEENKLILEFGDLYRIYKKNVPMLIPSLFRFLKLYHSSFLVHCFGKCLVEI